MGEFCVDGEAYELPKLFGLEVDGFGPVSFPLVDPQGSNLIGECQQTLFGKNGLTLVKTEQPCYFELDASRVRMRNPEWDVKLNELVRRVGKGLGCQEEIEVSVCDKSKKIFLFLF